jgi:uncharacterized protein (DUF1684 family)
MRLVVSCACLLLLSLSGCRQPPTGNMIHLPPPDEWQEQVTRDREGKDEAFRTQQTSPLLEADRPGFAGLEYWEPDSRFYFVGPVLWYADAEPFTIVTTAGTSRPCERVGRVEFELGGQMQTLQVYRLLDQQDEANLFLPFMDGTTGSTTYPSGRYVELEGPEGGPYVLDFNRSHNPFCAYGAPERYVCPVTPPENRLETPIEAGERGYKHADGTS